MNDADHDGVPRIQVVSRCHRDAVEAQLLAGGTEVVERPGNLTETLASLL